MIWNNESIDLLKSYLSKGESYRTISQKFNCSRDAIQHAVARYDLGQFRIQAPNQKKLVENLNLEELNDANFEELKKEAKLKWNIIKSEKPINKKKEYKVYIAVSDIHNPYENKGAMNCVFQLMQDISFDGIINMGDFMDFSCISHHNKGKQKTLEGLRLKKDYIAGNVMLDKFDSLLPKNAEKYYLRGNHESWLDMLLEENPVLDGLFDLDSALKLTERGYKIYPYNEIVKLGKLCITHGIYTGSNVARQHATKFLSNALVGHVHSPEMALIHSPSKEISTVGYVNGCLCSMSPDYLKGKPNSWANGFAILYLFPDDCFDVHLIRIVKNRFIYNGKVYNGNIK
jgi:hypothetical protein